MRRRRALSLIEVLAAATIVIVLTAIGASVYTQGQERSRKAVIISNLRQVGLAVQIYRDSEGLPSAEIGLPSEMGVPSAAYVKGVVMRPLMKDWPVKMENIGGAPVAWTLELNYGDDDASPELTASWLRHAAKSSGNPVIVRDFYFSDAESYFDPFGYYRGIGLRLDGSITEAQGYGNVIAPDWWD